MLISLPKVISLKLNDFLSEEDYNKLKKNYKGYKIAFYVYIDDQSFNGQFIDGTTFNYGITENTLINLHNKLKLGLPVYSRHKEFLNENRNDLFIGEIVYKTLTKINGILMGIIGFLIRNNDLYYSDVFDAISLEGKNLKVENNILVDLDITGFALTNSKKNLPASDYAYKIDEIQLYFSSKKKNNDDIKNMNREITFEDVKEYIRANKIKPSELFDSYTILGSIEINENGINLDGGDERIQNIFRQKLKNFSIVKKDEFDNFKKNSEEYLRIKPSFENYKKYYLNDIKNKKIIEYLDNNQIDDKLKKFILLNSEDFELQNEENIDNEIKNLIEISTKKYKMILENIIDNKKNENEQNKKNEENKNYF